LSNLDIETVSRRIKPILRKFGVKRAGIFGSVARGENIPGSDLDLLIQVEKTTTLIKLLSLKNVLEDLLKTHVDLVEYSMLKPERRDEVLSEEVKIFEEERS